MYRVFKGYLLCLLEMNSISILIDGDLLKKSDCEIYLEHDVQSLIFFNCKLRYSSRGTKVSGE